MEASHLHKDEISNAELVIMKDASTPEPNNNANEGRNSTPSTGESPLEENKGQSSEKDGIDSLTVSVSCPRHIAAESLTSVKTTKENTSDKGTIGNTSNDSEIIDELGDAIHFCQFCSKCPPQKASVLCEVCAYFYCEKCAKQLHPNRGEYASHLLLDVQKIEPGQYLCLTHKRRLDLLCSDCCRYCCFECAIGEHKTHNVIKLQDAAIKMKERAEMGYGEISQALDLLGDFQGKIIIEKGRTMMKKETACLKINGHFAHLYQVLENYEKALLLHVEEETNRELSIIEDVQERYDKTAEETCLAQNQFEDLFKERNNKHILSRGTALLMQADNILGQLNELGKMEHIGFRFACKAKETELPASDKESDRSVEFCPPIGKEICSFFEAPEPIQVRKKNFIISSEQIQSQFLFPCSYFIHPPSERNSRNEQRVTYYRVEVAKNFDEVYGPIPFSKELTINDTLFVCGIGASLLPRQEETGAHDVEAEKQTENEQQNQTRLETGHQDTKSETVHQGTESEKVHQGTKLEIRHQDIKLETVHQGTKFKAGNWITELPGIGQRSNQSSSRQQRNYGPLGKESKDNGQLKNKQCGFSLKQVWMKSEFERESKKVEQVNANNEFSGLFAKTENGNPKVKSSDPDYGQLKPGSLYRVKMTPCYQGKNSGLRVYGTTAEFTITAAASLEYYKQMQKSTQRKTNSAENVANKET